MILFEEKIRTDKKPSKYSDPDIFGYLDRTDDEEAEFIRDILNSWFINYIDSDKDSLKKRLMKSFESTFYELFIHELFFKQGFTLTAHPTVAGSTNKPDYLAIGHGLEFYIEAKVATDKTNEEAANDKMKAVIRDAINECASPNFTFAIYKLKIKSKRQPSCKKLVKKITDWSNSFDPDIVQEEINLKGSENRPKLLIDNEEIKLEMVLIPKSIESRAGENDRNIQFTMGDFYKGGADGSIRGAIEKKATRYGKPNRPFIVCINSTSYKGVENFTVENALFGSFKVKMSKNTFVTEEFRGADGIFQNTKGAKYTRMSGVMINNIHIGNLKSSKHWLVEHPFSANVLDFTPFELTKLLYDKTSETFVENQLKSVSEILYK